MSIFSYKSTESNSLTVFENYTQTLYGLEEAFEGAAWKALRKAESDVEGVGYAAVFAGALVISTLARGIFGTFGRSLLALLQLGANALLFIPSLVLSCCVSSKSDFHIKQVVLHILEGLGQLCIACIEWTPFFWHGVDAVLYKCQGEHPAWYPVQQQP